tara:strand:- start:436 stop:1728 length:1293 start_codon:yes stop_codon:yes gene_type:complete
MASASLSRAGSDPQGSNTTATFSVWIKRSTLTSDQSFWGGSYYSTDNMFILKFSSDDKLQVYSKRGASVKASLKTTRQLRDVAAWYHIVVAIDTTQGSAADRIKVYINGVQETSFSTNTTPSQNENLYIDGGAGTNYYIGQRGGNAEYFDGQMTHFHYVDGTAYPASTFGEADANGIWKPKTAPSVTYGNKGVFLKFDNSGNMGLDSSGNSNNFTTSGTVLQTGDTPSNNYVVWDVNNRNSSTGVTNFARTATNDANAWRTIQAGMPMIGTTGKFYAEGKATSGTNFYFGVYDPRQARGDSQALMDSNRLVYNYSGEVVKTLTGESTVTGLTAISAGNIIGIAVDKDNGVIKFYNNGTLIHTATNANITNKDLIFGTQMYGNMTVDWNFGHGFFGTSTLASSVTANNGIWEYTPPTGHYALNTKSMKDNS